SGVRASSVSRPSSPSAAAPQVAAVCGRAGSSTSGSATDRIETSVASSSRAVGRSSSTAVRRRVVSVTGGSVSVLAPAATAVARHPGSDLGPALEAHLGEEGGDVVLHRFLSYPEPLGDLPVGEPLPDEIEHAQFRFRELGGGVRPALIAGEGALIEQGPARGDRVDDVGDLRSPNGFQYERLRPDR